MTWSFIAPILLLCVSNVFMTFAWYGQLKFPATPLPWVIAISWAIAFFEYCLAVPANRIGHMVYSAAQLKTMQEIITLVVFAIFSVTYLGGGAALESRRGVPVPVRGSVLLIPQMGLGARPDDRRRDPGTGLANRQTAARHMRKPRLRGYRGGSYPAQNLDITAMSCRAIACVPAG